MDHLLANSDNPIPAAGETDPSASGSGGAGGGVDGDEDDDEALKMHIKKTGASDEPVANVRRLRTVPRVSRFACMGQSGS